jgi:hypothetical protein
MLNAPLKRLPMPVPFSVSEELDSLLIFLPEDLRLATLHEHMKRFL